MLCFTHPDPSVLQEPRGFSPMKLANPAAQPGRERLRHLIIGSPAGVRAEIKVLHVLTYAEQHLWSELITVPESGVVISPEQGQVFSYLVRDRRLG